jgi:hypothetical protein
MNTKHSTAPAPTDTRPIARTVRSMRLEAFTLSVIAAGIVAGSVAAAVWFERPALALLGLVAAWPALSAYWLNDGAAREAERMPPKPKRTQARWFMRLYWWIARRQMQRAAQPKPWRGIAVAGEADAIKIAYQPGEAAHEHDPVIVAGMTAKDLYHIAQEAATLRTLDERSWKLTEYTRVLPSGPVLSRGMFRKAQGWFADNGLADKRPYYHLCVPLDDVARRLQEE